MQRLAAIPGERENSVVYHHDGYLFYKDPRPNLIYRCALRGAPTHSPGRVYVLNDDLEIDNNDIVEHTHRQDPLAVQKIEFKRELFHLARTTYRPIDEIYRTLSLEDRFRDAAVSVTFKSVRGSMFRHRQLNVPATPQTLADMVNVVDQFEPIRHLYAGSCRGADGSIALIFMNPEFIEPLRRCRMLFGDGTFKIRPNHPNDISQIYTLHFMKLLSGFPAVMAFTNRKTTEMYVSILEFLLDRIPELVNLPRINVDFELGMIAAVRQVLPNTLIAGCFFHYVYAIIKYWRKHLRMPDTEEYEIYLEYALALAYLPAHEIPDAARALFQRMVDNDAVNALEFYTYYRRTWIPMAQRISVFGRRIKTNNICENFHSIAINIIGEAQGIWLMLSKVVELFAHYTNRYNQVMMNGQIKYGWTAGQLERDQVVTAAEAAFQDIGVEEFLHVIVVQRRITRLFPQLQFEDDEDVLAEVEGIIGMRPLLVRENYDEEIEEADREGQVANRRGRPPGRGRGGDRGGRGRRGGGEGRGGRGGGGRGRRGRGGGDGGRGGRGGRGGGDRGGRGGRGGGDRGGRGGRDGRGGGGNAGGQGGRRGRGNDRHGGDENQGADENRDNRENRRGRRGREDAGAGNRRGRRHENNEQDIDEEVDQERHVRLVRDLRGQNRIQFIFQRQDDIQNEEVNRQHDRDVARQLMPQPNIAVDMNEHIQEQNELEHERPRAVENVNADATVANIIQNEIVQPAPQITPAENEVEPREDQIVELIDAENEVEETGTVPVNPFPENDGHDVSSFTTSVAQNRDGKDRAVGPVKRTKSSRKHYNRRKKCRKAVAEIQQLRQQLQNDQAGCIVCFGKANMVWQKCGHYNICQQCYERNRMASPRCVECRKPGIAIRIYKTKVGEIHA